MIHRYGVVSRGRRVAASKETHDDPIRRKSTNYGRNGRKNLPSAHLQSLAGQIPVLQPWTSREFQLLVVGYSYLSLCQSAGSLEPTTRGTPYVRRKFWAEKERHLQLWGRLWWIS